MMVTVRSVAGVSVRSWIYFVPCQPLSVSSRVMAMRKRGGCTSSNPQILLGADEGGGSCPWNISGVQRRRRRRGSGTGMRISRSPRGGSGSFEH